MLLSLLSCDNAPATGLPDQDADSARLATLLAEIETLIADKSCKREGQCKAMAYGSKACGGPVGYLVYSSGNVNEKELSELVEEYTSLQSSMNDKYGLTSDCSIPSQPDVSCMDGNCE